MKILLVSEAKSIHTRRWAQSLQEQGYEVHVASFRPVEVPGATLHPLANYGLGRLGYFLAVPKLRKIAKQVQPDIVHAHYLTSYGLITALATLHPLVLTGWGSDILITSRNSRLMRAFVKFALRNCEAITTSAQHMNDEIARWGFPSSKMEAIPFGVDLRLFVPPKNPRPQTRSLRLICTRNFQPIYSVHTVLEAVALVNQTDISLQVDLVGEGPTGPALEELAIKLGIKDQVTFHGHVNHERVASLLAAADIFVTPALSDGNNISLNEAMACACFPIATDIPANSYWIEHGKNGYLYPCGDAKKLADSIQQAIQQEDLRNKSASINLEIVKARANWHVCIDKMKTIYNNAIEKVQQRKNVAVVTSSLESQKYL